MCGDCWHKLSLLGTKKRKTWLDQIDDGKKIDLQKVQQEVDKAIQYNLAQKAKSIQP